MWYRQLEAVSACVLWFFANTFCFVKCQRERMSLTIARPPLMIKFAYCLLRTAAACPQFNPRCVLLFHHARPL